MLLVIQGILPLAIVFLTRSIVNQMLAAAAAHGAWTTIRPLLISAAVMAGAMLLSQTLQTAAEWVRTAQSELIQDYISRLIHEKAIELDMSYYDSPDFYDQLFRVRTEVSTRPQAILESLGAVLQNGITLVAMGTVLLPYGVWLPLVLALSTAPALWAVVRMHREQHQWWERTTIPRRRAQYCDLVLTEAWAAAEMRLFGLGPRFKSVFQQLRNALRQQHLNLLKRHVRMRFFASLMTLVCSGAALTWMTWRTLLGRQTLGDLALFYQAFYRGENILKTLLASVGQIYSNGLFLTNLFEFLNLKPNVKSPALPTSFPAPLCKGIEFENVTFTYPGAAQPTLRNFTLTMGAGRTVAIVGMNGAGKSTLLKLLCRFYDPDSGSIRLDGIDLREMDLTELRRQISVLFQTPVAFQATARENVAMGNNWGNPTAAEVERAAVGAGAHEIISRLPDSYDTQLGRWFPGGCELSAGEWQKIALARAFLRRSEILVLDEPTSFMDSWSEADWFERFRALAENRTAIVITHRFSIAARADMIHVMRAGEIVESGTHAELVAYAGLYAQSWSDQMQASGVLLGDRADRVPRVAATA
jgi:ATP-binding cassette subfamily B protein